MLCDEQDEQTRGELDKLQDETNKFIVARSPEFGSCFFFLGGGPRSRPCPLC